MMDIRIKQRVLQLLVLTLPLLLDTVHCCKVGSDPQSDCPRLALKVINTNAGNLDWIVGDIASMVKSNYLDDIFYISGIDLGFYMFNTSDNTHSEIRHSAELKSIDQLIQVNESVMLAVDESADLAVLISLDNTSSDTTLLCKENNCCLNSSPCFNSTGLQLGKVAVNPENPYNLFFVDGSRIHQLKLNVTTQDYTVSLLHHIKGQDILQLTLTNDFNTLVAVTNKVDGTAKAVSYYTFDLTAALEAPEEQIIAAPNDLKSTLQLGGDILITLGGNKKEMRFIDMVRNRTQNLCTAQDSSSILMTSQDSNCQALDNIYFITADEDFIYALERKGKRRLLVIRYTVLGKGSSPPLRNSEDVTVHVKSGSTEEGSNWMETAIILLSTGLSLLIIGIVCCSVLIYMRKYHQPSKRHTLQPQQAPSHDIQDIELMEIGLSSSHQQPPNESSVQQSISATSSQEAANNSLRVRPLPPLPSNLVSDTEVDNGNYETPLSCVNPINQIPQAPPPPCPGPSTSHKKTLAHPVRLQHSDEHSDYYDSSTDYCDKPQNNAGIPRAKKKPANVMLDPTVLRETLSAIQSTSNQRVSSVTLTSIGNKRKVKFNLDPKQVPPPDHEYLTINDN